MSRVAVVLAVAALLASPRASANGAFPDSLGILLPADRPHHIIAATNFGLLVSEDDGASWGWVCEEAVGSNAALYELGAPPNDLVLATSFTGLTYSADFGCAWNRAGGDISSPSYFIYDVSPHPVDPLRSYVLARHGRERTAHESQDGAETYGPPFLSSELPETLRGIENARSRPETLYVTLFGEPYPAVLRPYIERSYDSGGTWQPRFDPGPAFDQWNVALIGVDPVDEKRVYLRLRTTRGAEALAIYDDDPEQQTGTMRIALANPPLRSVITAFLRRSDGALIVGSRIGDAFISIDQGATFATWPDAPHLRGLGERNGILYAVADDRVDGYAVGRSTNQGASWEPLLRFGQLTGPKNCGDLPSICAGPWQTLRRTLGISERGGGIDGGVDGGSDAGNPGTEDGGGPAPRQARSGCSQGPSGEGVSWFASAMILAVVAIRLLAYRRRPPL